MTLLSFKLKYWERDGSLYKSLKVARYKKWVLELGQLAAWRRAMDLPSALAKL